MEEQNIAYVSESSAFSKFTLIINTACSGKRMQTDFLFVSIFAFFMITHDSHCSAEYDCRACESHL